MEVRYKASIEIGNSYESFPRQDVNEKCLLTWNDIFYSISPRMIWEETSEDVIKHAIEILIEDEESENIQNTYHSEGFSTVIHTIDINRRYFDSIMIQLWALGYINKSTRQQHWTLTPYGLKIMLEKQAVKKDDAKIAGDSDIPF